MNHINFEKMVEALAKDGSDIISGLTSESAHLLHMAVGVQGEIGELIENYLWNGSQENRIEEFGDVEFYLQGIAGPLNYSISLDVVDSCSVSNDLLGLSVAGAALLDAIKKQSIYEKQLDADEVLRQMIEIRQRLVNLYYIFGITREQAIAANIAKLGKRYADGNYSNKSAQERADKA